MYLIWTKRDCIAAVAALAIAASGSSAVAAGVEADLPIPASLFASATVDGCENNPGPTITLSGELTLGGLNGRLIFRNNRRGTHERTEDVTVDLTLLPAGETIEFAPGGLHIMLIDLHRDLLVGERFELVLVFEEAGEIMVESEVRAP